MTVYRCENLFENKKVRDELKKSEDARYRTAEILESVTRIVRIGEDIESARVLIRCVLNDLKGYE